MKRVELYAQLLKAVNVVVEKDDQLFMEVGDIKNPVLYEGKPFYLPTKQNLEKSAFETENYLFFDPLTESMMRQESESVKALRLLMISRIQYSASRIVSNLINVLRDESLASKAKGNQMILYRQNIQPSSTTNRSYTKLLREGIKSNVANRIVNIFLKRGGELDGERYARLAVVDFPILDARDNKLNSIFGVDMSARDKETILDLLSFIFFGSKENTDDEFTAGSNIKMAPYFQSLCFAFCNLAHRINKVHKTYKGLYDPEEVKAGKGIHIDLGFEPNIQELNVYKKDPMPLLAGNTGNLKPSSVKKDEAVGKDVVESVDNVAETAKEMMVDMGRKMATAPANKRDETRIDVKPRVISTSVNSQAPAHSAPQIATQHVSPGKSFRQEALQPNTNAGNVQRVTTLPRVSSGHTQQYAQQYVQPVQQVVKKVVVVEQPQYAPPPVEEVVYVDQFGNPLDPAMVPQPIYEQQPQYVSPRVMTTRQQYAPQHNVNRYTGEIKNTGYATGGVTRRSQFGGNPKYPAEPSGGYYSKYR